MYKPYPLIIWLLLLAFFIKINPVSGQTTQEAWELYSKRQYNAAYQAALTILSTERTSSEANLIAGRSLVAERKYKPGIDYLETVLKFPDVPNSSRAWALNDLGVSYFYLQDYVKSKQALEQSYQLNATKNATVHAGKYLRLLGLDPAFDTWIKKETPHFIFHFQDTVSVADMNAFMQNKERAFGNINSFFNAALPKKIDYFVWRKAEEAKIFLNTEIIAFSIPHLCLTHTTYDHHTVGHEMTHSISYYSTPSIRRNRLIAEGVCVYFDQSQNDNMKRLKDNIKSPISVVSIWQNMAKAEDGIIYPLGGELVERLIEAFGREKFIAFLANQSYDNATKVFGSELNEVINKLQNEINN